MTSVCFPNELKLFQKGVLFYRIKFAPRGKNSAYKEFTPNEEGTQK